MPLASFFYEHSREIMTRDFQSGPACYLPFRSPVNAAPSGRFRVSIHRLFLEASIFLIALLLLKPARSLAQEPTKEIKIGVVLGLSGPAQLWGNYSRKGLELARDEINGRGGIRGDKLKLLFEDSETNPAKGVGAYKKLVTIDKAQLIIGDTWAFLTNPLIPLSEKDDVVLFSPTIVEEAVTENSSRFFSMGEHIKSITEAVDLFFRTNPHVSSVGIFCWDDPWGAAYRAVWRQRAEALGKVVKAEICSLDYTGDMRSDVAKMAKKGVDAVFVSNRAGAIITRMREQRFKAAVFSTSNLNEELNATGELPERFEGVYFADWVPHAAFQESFRSRFGTNPIVGAYNSYELLHAVARALESLKAAGGPLTSSLLITHLRTLQYTGVAGKVDFSTSAFPNKTIASLLKVTKGRPEIVR